jgi:hypothetical protein
MPGLGELSPLKMMKQVADWNDFRATSHESAADRPFGRAEPFKPFSPAGHVHFLHSLSACESWECQRFHVRAASYRSPCHEAAQKRDGSWCHL